MLRKLLLITILFLLLAACAPATPTAAPTPAPITVTDGTGRSVTLAAPAQRIVTLAPSNTEILFAIGAGSLLVGRDDYSDYPAEAVNITSIGNLYPNTNAEAVVALQPDLVLAGGITSDDDVKALSALGLTVYKAHNAKNLEDIYADILALGQLTGHESESGQLVDDFRARVEAVTAKTDSASAKPAVLYEIDATEPSKPWTAGPGSFIDLLITMAGGENVGAVGNSDYFQLSLEQLVAQDPAVIVLGSATYGGQTPELVAGRVGWENIQAVKDGAVYVFDDNLVSRPGPRVVIGLETLAKLIHPELYK